MAPVKTGNIGNNPMESEMLQLDSINPADGPGDDL